jgi:putative ABC transport system substrate-binding protein
MEVVPLLVGEPVSEATVRAALSAAAGLQLDAPLVPPTPVFERFGRLVADFALESRIPSVGFQRNYAEAGLLLTYGTDLVATFRRLAHFVDRVLAGTDPAELPIEQPTKFDFVVNLRTARALGLTIPPEVLAFATEIIE